VSSEWILLALLAVALASFVQASTGFGFALIAAPFLLMGLEVRVAVMTLLCLHSLQCAAVLASAWRSVSWALITPLVVGGLVGTPIGAIIFRTVEPEFLRFSVGFVIVVSGAILLATSPRPIAAERAGAAAAGFLTGMLNSGTGLSGPPIALFLGNQGWEGDRFRLALLATFLASNLAALAVYVLLGVPSVGIMQPVAILAPAVLVGILAERFAGRGLSVLNGPRLRPAIGTFVIVAGLVSVAGALTGRAG
jgi:uncharacterized membrane protein YfcA